MLVIRLRRAGSKNRPFFRVVVTESRSARDGRFTEVLGHYNPRTKPETLVIDRERAAHWLKAGARPSDTVRTLIDRLPADDASQIAGRHGQLDDRRAAAIELRHAHVGRTAGQGLRHDLDHVACAAHDATASVAGASAGSRSIRVRTVSDGCAPALSQ